MPSLYTHYDFGKKVLNNLDKTIKLHIEENLNYYNMFNQGFDNLYYHFKWTYYKNFGIKAHNKKIKDFFYYLITYLKTNNLTNDSTCTNFLYGLINHYTLDTLVHPFINYQVQNLNIAHAKLEFMLDYYLYEVNEKSKFNKKMFKTLIPKLKFEKELTKLIDNVFELTHNEKNIGKVFKQSHNNGYLLYKYFIYDKYGIKTFFYKLFDSFTSKNKFKFHENTFYIKNFNEDILNKKHLKWHNPKNKLEKYNYSFLQLYDYSIVIATKLNTMAHEVLNNNLDINFFLKELKKVNIKNIQELQDL